MIDIKELHAQILKGNRMALARAITLVESSKITHQNLASSLLKGLASYTGKSYRIAITGAPGAGKSTFINSFGSFLCGIEKKVAVLTIDPSSALSKGSILGDKTRMEELSKNPLAFIRPSPSGGEMGGIARRTREAILLCEAAGFDIILVETVGVGQNETVVKQLTDMFLLLLVTGSGDDLQGIKRGIMEMADLLLINKADGENMRQSEQYRIEIANAMHLFMANPNGWVTQSLSCSSVEHTGMEKIWNEIQRFFAHVTINNQLEKQRLEQHGYWFHKLLEEALLHSFLSSETYLKFNTDHTDLFTASDALKMVQDFRNARDDKA